MQDGSSAVAEYVLSFVADDPATRVLHGAQVGLCGVEVCWCVCQEDVDASVEKGLESSCFGV